MPIKKNTALANFEFFMADSADHVTGKTPRFTYREYPGASKGGASDNTKRIELIGKCEVGWKEGFKKMWEQQDRERR